MNVNEIKNMANIIGITESHQPPANIPKWIDIKINTLAISEESHLKNFASTIESLNNSSTQLSDDEDLEDYIQELLDGITEEELSRFTQEEMDEILEEYSHCDEKINSSAPIENKKNEKENFSEPVQLSNVFVTQSPQSIEKNNFEKTEDFPLPTDLPPTPEPSSLAFPPGLTSFLKNKFPFISTLPSDPAIVLNKETQEKGNTFLSETVKFNRNFVINNEYNVKQDNEKIKIIELNRRNLNRLFWSNLFKGKKNKGFSVEYVLEKIKNNLKKSFKIIPTDLNGEHPIGGEIEMCSKTSWNFLFSQYFSAFDLQDYFNSDLDKESADRILNYKKSLNSKEDFRFSKLKFYIYRPERINEKQFINKIFFQKDTKISWNKIGKNKIEICNKEESQFEKIILKIRSLCEFKIHKDNVSFIFREGKLNLIIRKQNKISNGLIMEKISNIEEPRLIERPVHSINLTKAFFEKLSKLELKKTNTKYDLKEFIEKIYSQIQSVTEPYLPPTFSHTLLPGKIELDSATTWDVLLGGDFTVKEIVQYFGNPKIQEEKIQRLIKPQTISNARLIVLCPETCTKKEIVYCILNVLMEKISRNKQTIRGSKSEIYSVSGSEQTWFEINIKFKGLTLCFNIQNVDYKKHTDYNGTVSLQLGKKQNLSYLMLRPKNDEDFDYILSDKIYNIDKEIKSPISVPEDFFGDKLVPLNGLERIF